MSPTSYQAAPPRGIIIAEARKPVKSGSSGGKAKSWKQNAKSEERRANHVTNAAGLLRKPIRRGLSRPGNHRRDHHVLYGVFSKEDLRFDESEARRANHVTNAAGLLRKPIRNGLSRRCKDSRDHHVLYGVFSNEET